MTTTKEIIKDMRGLTCGIGYSYYGLDNGLNLSVTKTVDGTISLTTTHAHPHHSNNDVIVWHTYDLSVLKAELVIRRINNIPRLQIELDNAEGLLYDGIKKSVGLEFGMGKDEYR